MLMPQGRYILERYGVYSVKLAELLKNGRKFSSEEQMFIENHLLIVQLAMAMSKYTPSKKSTVLRGQ
jgi:hypothetical protein